MPSRPTLLRLPLCCRARVEHDGPGRPRHPEDCAMEDTLRDPRELIAVRAVFTPADHAQIALCRGAHNRLGFAYQMAFLRLTGRFPNQQPLELLPDVLAFVASELALAPTVIETYAQRQATVSAHQEQIRLHLGFRALGLVEREALSHFLREEALHLDHLAALVPRSRGQEEPRDFCSGEELSYDLRPYSAMMLPRKLCQEVHHGHYSTADSSGGTFTVSPRSLTASGGGNGDRPPDPAPSGAWPLVWARGRSHGARHSGWASCALQSGQTAGRAGHGRAPATGVNTSRPQ